MLHPKTQLRYIDDNVGYGIFATELIPKGTITYVTDPLEIEIKESELQKYPIEILQQIEKYSYRNEQGTRIVSWDFAKYINHCCQCNSMSTAYGFEIALRDIQTDEQITDEYGLMNPTEDMTLSCNVPTCRKKLSPKDIDKYYPQWDQQVQEALQFFNQVDQPLSKWVTADILLEVNAFLQDPHCYQSVKKLKYQPSTSDNKELEKNKN